ncbi:S8 family serine peptidase [Sphingomonas jaspsi]|uniref:S8 family serine peptidase n=1 Tax=Sphingomonas jaspsi TaxID=392409 RepID=UPI0004BC34C0|nr:S8 family serine peptidase [Sphingomonas jaspsi]
MESALVELFHEGAPDDVVPVIIRLHPGQQMPAAVRAVASFGLIHTARILRSDIFAVRDLVASMKKPQDYTAATAGDEEEVGFDDLTVLTSDHRRSPDMPTGRGVVLCHLDWGLDFTHPAFRNSDGSTRLVALWDQAGRYDPARPNIYGFGRIHSRADINAALATPDPFRALGYRWWSSDSGRGSHGTHTLGIAGGSALPDIPAGYAPGADLLFVDLSTRTPAGPQPLGNSTDLLEGIDFADRCAGDRCLVVNASLGRQAGQHDGLTLTEQALDYFLTRRTGRAMTMSCGNYRNKHAHTHLLMTPGERRSLTLQLAAGQRKAELDIWYSRNDRLRIGCTGPDGLATTPLDPGGTSDLTNGHRIVGRLYHRGDDPNNGDRQVSLFLHGDAPAGAYTMTFEALSIGDGRVHAWVERDPAGAARLRFSDSDDDPRSTVGTICNGFATIAVAAYDAHQPDRPPGPFSSQSPTRDGRTSTPRVAAPGVKVLGPRSTPHSGGAAPSATRMSGTSMAAPAVAGTIAMLFDCAGRPLSIDDVSALVVETADPVAESDRERLGAGYLNPAAAIAACRSLPVRAALPIPRQPPLSPRPQFRVPHMQEAIMSSQEEFEQTGEGHVCDSDSELEMADDEQFATDEEFFATMEGDEAELDEAESLAEGSDALGDGYRRRGGWGGGLPFQFQIPIGGSGGLGIGVPIGGRNSPFSIGIPLGGTTPPAPAAGPTTIVNPGQVVVQPGAPGTVVTMPTPLDQPIVTALDLPQDPVSTATELAVAEAELGEDADFDTDAEQADAEADAAMLEEAGRIAALQQEWALDDYREVDARYEAEQLIQAAESLEAVPEGSDALCRMLGERVGTGNAESEGEASTSLYELFSRVRHGEESGLRLLGRAARIILSPGAALDERRPRRGDIMLRMFPGQRFVQLSVVASPELISLDRLGQRGLQPEGRGDPLPGRYVQVVEAWPMRRTQDEGFARRLTNAADIVSLDTMILRLMPEGYVGGDSDGEDDPAHPRLAPGAHGPDVVALQRRLNELHQRREAAGMPGLANMPLAEDGQYGPRLQAAVQSMQRLAPPAMVPSPSGIMDEGSWRALAFLEAAQSIASVAGQVRSQARNVARAVGIPTGTSAGQETVEHVPLLASHRGTSPDLLLRWNDMPAGTSRVDVVVHLHGFSGHGAAMRIDRDKLPISGLDFFDPDHPGSTGRTAPTLCIMPRGNYYGGRTHMGYDFPALFASGAFNALIRFALERFAASAGIANAQPGRVILTGHSGGGAAIMRLLAENDPDEIYCFDALYNNPAPLIRWAQDRLSSGRGATSALRIMFREGEGTARNSHAVAAAIAPALAGHPDLAARFRAEPVPVQHNDIPRRFGWRLLADATADLGLGQPRAPRRQTPHDAADGGFEFDMDTDGPSEGLAQAEVDRLARCTFSDSAGLERFFTQAGGFADWFNRTLSGHGPFVRPGRGGVLRVPTGDEARERFRRFWDRLDLAYRQPSISLLEFASLMAIVLNETDGNFAGRTESSGRGGGGRTDSRGHHRGLAYFFDRIELRPGHFKASYNRLSGGRTAGSLFNDPVYIRAHGSLGGADRFAHHGDDDNGVWNGDQYPADHVPTDEHVADTAFIREADFYKFRGRGIIQTTGRPAYLRLVQTVKTYRGSNPVLTALASAWAAMSDQDACTASTNAQWEQLFALPETLGMAFALHSPGYRIMSRQADILNAVPAPGHRGQAGSIFLMGRRISGSADYGAHLYRDRVVGLLRGMLQLPLDASASAAPPTVPARPSSQERPRQETDPQPATSAARPGHRLASVRPQGRATPPDEATARSQWDAHPRVHHHFHNQFDTYFDMAPKFAARGVADAAAYLADNMTELNFMGHRTPGHRGFVAPLAEAEAMLRGHQVTPPVTSFWSLNVRTMRDNASLSLHSLGLAFDINPRTNPHIQRAWHDEFAVIHAVTGVDLLRTRDPARLRAASDQFSRDFNSQWVATQTDPAIVRALRNRRTLERLQGWATTGLCTLDLALIEAFLAVGLRWGGQWNQSKDFMHFELP